MTTPGMPFPFLPAVIYPLQNPFLARFMTIDNLGTKVFEANAKEDACIHSLLGRVRLKKYKSCFGPEGLRFCAAFREISYTSCILCLCGVMGDTLPFVWGWLEYRSDILGNEVADDFNNLFSVAVDGDSPHAFAFR